MEKTELDMQVVKSMIRILVKKTVLCRQEEHGKYKRRGLREKRRRLSTVQGKRRE